MRRLFILIVLVCVLTVPVQAMEFTAPTAPESATKYMPDQTESFGQDLWYILKNAISLAEPDLADAAAICFSLIAVVLLTSVIKSFSGISGQIVEMVSILLSAALLIQPSNSLIHLGITTIESLSEYGKLLLPVMTAAFAAQGAPTASAALYTGTAVFNTLLTGGITKLIIPLLYIYIALILANSAMQEQMLSHLRSFVKWLMTWCLKITIYLFTGYLSITGVVSGAADASAIKATRLAVSGMIPVVGKIVSDASETILVSAGIMKNATGIYGMLAILSIFIGPFLKIGIQYLLLKATAAICGVLGGKRATTLIQDFSSVMGFVLAVTGTVCLLLMISTVCFMRGVM